MTQRKSSKKSSVVKKMKKSIKKNQNKRSSNINIKTRVRKLTTRRHLNKMGNKVGNKVGGGSVELNDEEIRIFVAYLASDDREFITKCSKHVNSDVGDDENTTKVKAVLAKIFPDQKDCEGFALNVLGKVSLFKNLYDYHQRMTDKLRKEGGYEEGGMDIPELTPERIQRISKAMDGRCDVKSNNNSVSLKDNDKKVALDIVESVYSVDSIKSIFKTMVSEKEKIQPKLDSLKQTTNDPSVVTEITELEEFADMVEEITFDSEMINNISYDIRKIGLSYFGFSKDNKGCQDSIIMMGFIKALITIINPHNKFTHVSKEVKQKILKLIFSGIITNNFNEQINQSGGRNIYDYDDNDDNYGNKRNNNKQMSTFEKIDKFFEKTANDILDKDSMITSRIYSFLEKKINPQNVLTKLMTMIGLGIPILPFYIINLGVFILDVLSDFFIDIRLLSGIGYVVSSIPRGLLWTGYGIFKLFKLAGGKIGKWWKERKERKKTKKEVELMKLHRKIMANNAEIKARKQAEEAEREARRQAEEERRRNNEAAGYVNVDPN